MDQKTSCAFDPRIPKQVFQTVNRICKQEMDFFTHVCSSDQKTSLGTWCSFDPNIQKQLSEIGNGIFQTGNDMTCDQMITNPNGCQFQGFKDRGLVFWILG